MNKERWEPIRQCTGCRNSHSKSSLIRVVRQNNTLMIDAEGKINARGAYVCNDKKCIEKAIKNNSFCKTFKAQIPREVLEGLFKEMIAGEA